MHKKRRGSLGETPSKTREVETGLMTYLTSMTGGFIALSTSKCVPVATSGLIA